MSAIVLNKYKDRIPEDAVNIMRPSKWGNPFVIGRDGNREQVISKYAEWIKTHPRLIADAKRELNGKYLVCCCAPLPCHGDVLKKIIES
jgi:hypothetical protein